MYGTGKEVDCNYYYYGLNWDDGSTDLKLLLGPEQDFPDDPFYDQGVNHIIDEDGSIYFSGSRSLIKLERIVEAGEEESPEEIEEENEGVENPDLLLYPNPTSDILHFHNINLNDFDIEVFSSDGRLLNNWNKIDDKSISMAAFSDGIYYLVLKDGATYLEWKIIRRSQ